MKADRMSPNVKKHNEQLAIENSGNSNVNVTLKIDTTPLAYAMGCYLHTTKQLSDEEFAHMINNLRSMISKEDGSIPEFISNYLISSTNK